MHRIELLGHPVAHSRSPVFQSAAFGACGIAAEYVAVDVGHEGLVVAADRVRRGDVLGANITVPHKQRAYDLCDEHSEVAKVVVAVNTWHRDSAGRLVGDNTDVAGLIPSLEHLGVRSGGRALVLGAGGAARAAVVALADRGLDVIVANRTAARAQALVSALSPHAASRSCRLVSSAWPAQGDADWGVDLVVNATTLGLDGGAETLEALPWDDFGAATGCLDLVYGPAETPFISIASRRGHRALDGASMLVEQGALAFERWFDTPAPRTVMRDALARTLGRSTSSIPIRAS